MKTLKIVLEIEDQETVEAYQDVDENLILDDLQNGTLTKMCSIQAVSTEKRKSCATCGSKKVMTLPGYGDWCFECKGYPF